MGTTSEVAQVVVTHAATSSVIAWFMSADPGEIVGAAAVILAALIAGFFTLWKKGGGHTSNRSAGADYNEGSHADGDESPSFSGAGQTINYIKGGVVKVHVSREGAAEDLPLDLSQGEEEITLSMQEEFIVGKMTEIFGSDNGQTIRDCYIMIRRCKSDDGMVLKLSSYAKIFATVAECVRKAGHSRKEKVRPHLKNVEETQGAIEQWFTTPAESGVFDTQIKQGEKAIIALLNNSVV